MVNLTHAKSKQHTQGLNIKYLLMFTSRVVWESHSQSVSFMWIFTFIGFKAHSVTRCDCLLTQFQDLIHSSLSLELFYFTNIYSLFVKRQFPIAENPAFSVWIIVTRIPKTLQIKITRVTRCHRLKQLLLGLGKDLYLFFQKSIISKATGF